jgi:hypothetical protein
MVASALITNSHVKSDGIIAVQIRAVAFCYDTMLQSHRWIQTFSEEHTASIFRAEVIQR